MNRLATIPHLSIPGPVDVEGSEQMRVGVLGINHKLATVHLRELIAKACQSLFAKGTEVPSVLLSTCNRTEIYFSSGDLAKTHTEFLAHLRPDVDEPFDHKLYSFFGWDAFHHLARVSAGLDSAVVGESDIQRQVKLAYQGAAREQRLPSDLHFMFQKSLRIGKRVRTAYPVTGQMADVESVILRSARKNFPDLGRRRLLFVGASEINAKVLHRFKQSEIGEIVLCNRSLDRALEWGNSKRVDVCDWQELGRWVDYDVVVVGTRFPDFLLTGQELPLDGRRRLVVDLSVPRNVDPAIGKGATLLNIDQVDKMVERGRQLKVAQVQEMEALIESSMGRYARPMPLQILAAS